ncbi:pectate lyase F [Colletotrichum orchidophilum]|uniref:Pectate lyase n=1 Tax=Colletotrichum orchidophilum TaxID=1209926 RepID=A0A1G4ARD1_9PEZI|nr:pectate lyase F [Colletotrichum orchidophilum]OHE91666.1 pectate lyase F [Colletotrichum orchidophilum]
MLAFEKINYYVEDCGKLSRSYGKHTCDLFLAPECRSQCKRNVHVESVTAKNGGELAGTNLTYTDTATPKNVCADAKNRCRMYNSCAGGCEPSEAGTCSG